MKTRFRGNSIRFRLTQGEVSALEAGDSIFDEVELTPTIQLRFEVQPTDEAVHIVPLKVGFRVLVPSASIAHWASGDDEAILAEVPVAEGRVTRIHLEKDFACLRPRDTAEDHDTFPHPNAGKSC